MSSPRTLIVPIDAVTVTEDRAHVQRRATIDLPAGLTRAVIEDVAPVIADKTLRIRADGVKAEARVVRRKVTTQPVEAHAALVKELEKRTRDVEECNARVRSQKVAVALADEADKRVLTEIAEDAARGLFTDTAGAQRSIQAIEEHERTALADLHAAEVALREAERTLARLRRRLAETGHTTERVIADLELTLAADTTRKSEIVVEYLVPGACWRPHHTATLAKDGTLTITTDACLWQNTGEEWKSVTLKLSTERPSLGQKPPLLDDDELVAQKRSEVIRVEQRDVSIEHAGLGAAPAPRVPGIDDGGEVRVLQAKARASIKSDGCPYRVPTVSMQTKATSSLVAYPELAEAVLVRAEQTNSGKSPLLAGPVDLVRESGFVGRTKLPLIAPNERFELGFGPDPHLRVRREVEWVDEDPGLLPTSFIGRSHRVRVHLSNLDDRPRKLTVTERIPVSEMEKVEIVFDEKKTTPRAKPDADGFVRWEVDLAARAQTTLSLRYVLRHHKDVVGL
jgi:uncharacterized protein (TIGR02231 family)